MQTGIDFIYSGIGKKSVYDVPLLIPQVGLSKVTLGNDMFVGDLVTRFSVLNKSIFTPYAEGFIGVRNTRSYITTTPYADAYCPQGKTRELKTMSTGLNYGLGGGVTTSFGKYVKLDVGVSYAEVQQDKNLIDISSGYADSKGINYEYKSPEKGIVMITVGLQFTLNLSKYKLFKPCDCSYSGYGWYNGNYISNVSMGRTSSGRIYSYTTTNYGGFSRNSQVKNVVPFYMNGYNNNSCGTRYSGTHYGNSSGGNASYGSGYGHWGGHGK